MAVPAPSTFSIAADTTAHAIGAAATITLAAGSRRSQRSSSAEERRVQPRRDLGDHDATAAAAATPNSDHDHAAPTESTRPDSSPASRLYRHALESILAFSDLNTLAAAVRVSKEWLGAVSSMGALSLKVEVKPALVESVAASAMSRHVADLHIIADEATSAGAMDAIARLMPHLRHLECPCPQTLGDSPLLFPAGLRELRLLSAPSASAINAAIEAAGSLEQMESLSLKFARVDPLISFAPLAALPLLRSLTISAAFGSDLTDAQVDELRALPRLQCLDACRISTARLRRLLAQPHDLKWQRISLPSQLTDEAAALLPQLPTLTALTVSAKNLTNFDFLLRLPNLTSLLCIFGYKTLNEILTDRLLATLRQCVNIAELSIAMCDSLTAAHLAHLLPHLLRLHSLTLTSLRIDTLGFLAQAPMTSQLAALRLVRCLQLPVSELRHVHSLRGLRELAIDGSFNEPMDPSHEALVALRPPSVALPLLESFRYIPPV